MEASDELKAMTAAINQALKKARIAKQISIEDITGVYQEANNLIENIGSAEAVCWLLVSHRSSMRQVADAEKRLITSNNDYQELLGKAEIAQEKLLANKDFMHLLDEENAKLNAKLKQQKSLLRSAVDTFLNLADPNEKENEKRMENLETMVANLKVDNEGLAQENLKLREEVSNLKKLSKKNEDLVRDNLKFQEEISRLKNLLQQTESMLETENSRLKSKIEDLYGKHNKLPQGFASNQLLSPEKGKKNSIISRGLLPTEVSSELAEAIPDAKNKLRQSTYTVDEKLMDQELIESSDKSTDDAYKV